MHIESPYLLMIFINARNPSFPGNNPYGCPVIYRSTNILTDPATNTERVIYTYPKQSKVHRNSSRRAFRHTGIAAIPSRTHFWQILSQRPYLPGIDLVKAKGLQFHMRQYMEDHRTTDKEIPQEISPECHYLITFESHRGDTPPRNQNNRYIALKTSPPQPPLADEATPFFRK